MGPNSWPCDVIGPPEAHPNHATNIIRKYALILNRAGIRAESETGFQGGRKRFMTAAAQYGPLP
jgi:hypothetical protein